MKVVSNTSPILCLFKIGKLGLLENLFGQVYIPQSVYDEINAHGTKNDGNRVLDSANFISVMNLRNFMAADFLMSQLDRGEAEAIILAAELRADLLILDEKKARRIVQAKGQRIIGTIGVLQVAKNNGLIPDMKSSIDALISHGMWLDWKLRHSVLSANNELD